MAQETLIERSTVLATKDGQHRSNAVVLSTMGNSTVKILTDFGNVIEIATVSDVTRMYEVSKNWIQAKNIGYPLDSLEEIIDRQIRLLTKVKELL